MAPLLLFGFFGQEGEALGRSGQAQVPEIVFELLIEGVRHDPAPVS